LIGRIARVALLLSVGAFEARAQVTVDVRDAGPGPGPQILARALSGPRAIVAPAASEYLVRRDSAVAQTLIVLGRTVVVEGTVHGDLIVVGGDLYMHPGGQIDGKAVAIGGGVYESGLAHVTGGVSAFRDFTYDIAPVGTGYSLTYRSLSETGRGRALRAAGLYGLLIPIYDRSNGLSLPIGAELTTLDGRLLIEPRVTYRSQLGRIDPWMLVTGNLRRGLTLVGSIGRSTYSNEAWINSDIINSLTVIAAGDDARNYFRATRGEASIVWKTDSAARIFTSYIGGRGEHALTVRPGVDASGGPWSFSGRRDTEDMLRPNPPVDNGVIASVITGTAVEWTADDIAAKAALGLELARFTPDSIAGLPMGGSRNFVQATFDGAISFPTFGLQSLRFEGHAVVTTHGTTPRQRWGYLGGPGTLSPLDMLELGGDQLIYVDGRYSIPLQRLQLPFVGAPLATLRAAFGGAGDGHIPTIHQAIGARLSLSVLYVEFMIDPATRHGRFGFGLSVTP
jgi:hypothetical protein